MSFTPQMEQTVIAVLNKAAEVYGLSEQTEVSIVLVDDEYIFELNRQYRDKDVPTDVLSFALNEGDEPAIINDPAAMLLGDIVISLETAARQAEEFGHGLERELAYLTLHGMLHLLGYDHETEEERVKMRNEEEYILSQLGITRD
nr:rRNA maturation RNase YbeY [Thermosinus carboxydivorans]